MRVVFMGTPDFSVPVLTEIIGQGHEVVACYTRAPKPAGRRGLELTRSPVHETADRFGIPVLTPKSLRSEAETQAFAAFDADVAVVVAYGLILPAPILETPVEGCLNLHASLLPRWRGAAPIQRSIMAGDHETGVMVMRMDEGLDTGPVAMAERVAIGENTTAGELHDALMGVGADLMVRALAALSRGSLQFHPQADDGAVYANKIEKAECRIDWAKPTQAVHNHIRGLSPFPGAFFEADFGKGPERVKVLRSILATGKGEAGTVVGDDLTIACGDGAVRLIEVQRAGKSPMSAKDFLRGAALPSGTRLT
ncbi:methionyl-tRNA formyltransferase [Methylocella sp. CPCC 101449]|uniref:methionyl-tRNA formyltransferase n=1 Tax=Methylocella sp. CPCC 101449 TaxID=2987531 RepID=UPI00289263CF|nr:methionyl-tRNA formyltransferase [Methylocella sp. CPCC 101449]MDT2019232.1 methionyl-tRNA formyltransferase [Methylocella sp. CPCC 101449]